jgi:hypothetical protein
MSADYTYPADAACAGHRYPTWWDQSVDGEPREEQGWRHEAALYVCRRRCPVRQQCADSVDRRYDEGVKGGKVLGPLRPEKYGFGGYGEMPGVSRRKRAG